MSGRKYARYQLERNINETLQCSLEARDLIAEATSRIQAFSEVTRSVSALKTTVDSAWSAIKEIQQKLGEIDNDLNRLKRKRRSLDRVRHHQQEIKELRRKIEEILKACLTGQKGANLRIEIAAVSDQLKTQQEDIRSWVEQAYDSLHQQVSELLVKVDRELGQTGEVSIHPDDIIKLSNQFSALRQQAKKTRIEDEQRRYVLDALSEVCRGLGFACTVNPQDKPADDLVMDVDTYSHGVIRFRLLLDGTIRSESEMMEASCGERFASIEDKLRSIGVVTAFRYEGDQRPVRLEKGAKSLPGTDNGAVAKVESTVK